jgi:DNA invertase Pin-like site-specific DNA recombinase
MGAQIVAAKRGRIMNRPAVIYAAKSTDDVHGSIPTQIADCEAMATREGWVIAGTYSDEAASAYRGNRGNGLVRAREHAELLAREHGEAALVVQHTDRLARGDGIAAQHLVEVLLWARKTGVRIRSVQDDSTGENLLMAAMMGERNYEDSRRKAAATAAGKRRAAERGESTGTVPDGYTVERTAQGAMIARRVVMNPERREVYRLLWNMATDGATVNSIVRELAAHGYRTAPKRARSRSFDATRVGKALVNPFYAGLVVSRGEIIGAGHWPAYIEPDEWYRLRRERSSNARYSSRGVGRPPSALLAKLVRCAECGGTIVQQRGGERKDGTRRRTYTCVTHMHRRDGCAALPFDAEQVESLILTNLGRLLGERRAWADTLLAGRKREQARLDGERKRAVDEIAECERAIERLVERYDAAVLSADDAEIDLACTATSGRRQAAEQAKVRLQAATDALTAAEQPETEESEEMVLARLWESLSASVSNAGDDVKALREALADHFDHFALRHDRDGGVQVFPWLSVEAIMRSRHERSILRAHTVLASKSAASNPGGYCGLGGTGVACPVGIAS